MRRWLLLLCLLAPLAQALEPLPPSLLAALQRAKLPFSALSLVILPLDGREPARVFNAQQGVNPASTMKLLTSYAALELLGPAWQWTTELRATALPQEGVLEGDLYWRGSGDPKLTIERVWLLLRDLRFKGVKVIRGDLVLDRHLFVLGAEESLFDDDGNSPDRPFLVGPDAALLNFKTVRLLVQATSSEVSVQLDPPLPQVRVENHLQLGPAQDCAQWRKQIRWQVDDRGHEAVVIASGTVPVACTGERYFSVLDHATYSASLIRQLWLDLGGQWQGGVRFEAAPAETMLLAQSHSPELPLMLRDINKFSNNLMARQLYLTLGAVRGEPEDGLLSGQRADAVIRRWLAGKGWHWPELVTENGSGLSRNERISARHLAELLQDAGRSALAAEFMVSLPIVGVDGTMKKRLLNEPLAGQAHIKTGSLKDVRAMAGYVRAVDGSLRVVVAVINHPRAAEGGALLDEVLRQAYLLPIGNSARP